MVYLSQYKELSWQLIRHRPLTYYVSVESGVISSARKKTEAENRALIVGRTLAFQKRLRSKFLGP
jgi:hypothetical protein